MGWRCGGGGESIKWRGNNVTLEMYEFVFILL